MLRAAAAALLLANALFLAWALGAFGAWLPAPGAAQREPARLAAQERPQAVTVLSPQAASAALAAGRNACLEAGPLSPEELASAQVELAALGVAPSAMLRHPPLPPPQFAVLLPRPAEAAALRAREAELRRLSLTPPELPRAATGGAGPAWLLSRHDAAEAAEAQSAEWTGRGLRGLRVVSLPSPEATAPAWLRVPAVDAALRARLAPLRVPLPFVACGAG